jgi:5,10-methylenetetrahydromethanopterin reductase
MVWDSGPRSRPTTRGAPCHADPLVAIRRGVWFFPDVPSALIVQTIERAEALGLDEVWLGDEGPARDPFALLAAAAARTSRIRLGIGVTNPYLRHPSVTAATALTIHELSGGRMILGLGPGGNIALGPAQVQRVAPLKETRRALRIIRAVCRGEATEGYTPPPHALAAADLPIYIGARGEAFNRLASESADGVFLAGIPRSRLQPTLAWAHSCRPVAVSVYPSAVFESERLEMVRPRMIYALLDAPEATRAALGLCSDDVRAAVDALSSGDSGPARRLIDDRLLDELLIHGSAHDAGRELANRVRPLQPASIGVALLTDDPLRTLEAAAEALNVAARELD